ncbi:MAG: pyridoxal phosphate-dependent aminotransferase [bacterium]
MSSLPVPQRARRTPASPIRKLAPLAQAAAAAGTKVYHLNIGQPDIKSPKEFFDGLQQFHESVIAYEPSQGSPSLCDAWSRYTNRTLKLNTKPEHFQITMGGSEALLFAFMACSDPGDEVLIFDPTYSNYIGFAAMSGITLIPVPTSIENEFALPSREEIERYITPKTRAILFCSPNNPTGTIYTHKEQQRLIDISKDRNLYLIADETYREFIYDGSEPFSIFHLDQACENIIVVDSMSKRFSLTGSRIGCLITCNEEILKTCLHFAQARLSCPTLEQYATAYMLDHISDDFVKAIQVEYRHRRDTLHHALSALPGVTSFKPHGAFYTLAKLPVENAEEFARFMLSEFSFAGATTFVAPGAGFYCTEGRGKDEVRIAYVLQAEDIEKAVELLGLGLEAFLKR